MGSTTVLALRVIIALALAGSLIVQAFIVPAIWRDLEGSPPWGRIAVVTLIVAGIVTMQIFAVCVWQLLTKVRKGSVFSPSSFAYVYVIVGSVAVAAVITFVMLAIDR